MSDDHEPAAPSVPAASGRDPQLADLVAPLAQLGIQTAQDIAAVIRSTGAAGRDLWRLVNVVDRVRRVDWPDAIAANPSGNPPAIEAAPAEPVEPARSAGGRSPFVRVADAALKPTVGSTTRMRGVGNAAVSSVRRAVAGPMGLTSEVSGDREEDLREVADRLIQRSLEPDAVYARRHPAFAQILTELTPDEARILRFLAVAGPQPSIDIRTKTPFQIGSERVVHGINMIAEMAGCRWPEFNQNYLSNLNRLGLVELSMEPVEDYRRYSLLEVQPDAVEAIEEAGRATMSVYRSVHLSAFGEQFCDVCIDTEGYDAGGWAVNERGDKVVSLFGRSRRNG